jgi:uncharacterized protein (TIGR00304 family)
MLDLALLGLGVVVAGILVIFLASVLASRPREGEEGREVEVRGGGVIMIGPIPIVFGSNPKWAVAAMVLAMVLLVMGLLLARRL